MRCSLSIEVYFSFQKDSIIEPLLMLKGTMKDQEAKDRVSLFFVSTIIVKIPYVSFQLVVLPREIPINQTQEITFH